MEPQQSSLYATYITLLKWKAIRIDNVSVFYRQFPFGMGVMKIHRPLRLPESRKLIPLITSYKIRTLVLEPSDGIDQNKLNIWCRKISRHVKINASPYLPTKTIRVDMTPTEEQIFSAFSEAKRRAVRKSIKLGVTVEISDSIDKLIRIKNKSSGVFGFITTTGIREFWHIFAPDHAEILLAYESPTSENIIGGVLLLYWDHVAYYWIAGATKHGKKLYAPTLLVWEALRLAKNHGCTAFDFVGVWDERLPKENTEWHGFTRFKEGFGGTTLYYPLINNR
jgi:lipid II:glycine glycyltransferase (peptidoglycan interpeptide bridge formation enzyme)